MPTLFELYQEPSQLIVGVIVVGIWSAIWKGIGLWFSGKNRQKKWFIAIFLLSDITLALLSIIYLIWFKPPEERKSEAAPKAPLRKPSSKRKSK